MIRIYTNQVSDNQEVIPFPSEVETTEKDWWMIYDADTKVIAIEPLQCSGYTSGPLTMVISDTKEELDQYIIDNKLLFNLD
jgi:hypothetical protein